MKEVVLLIISSVISLQVQAATRNCVELIANMSVLARTSQPGFAEQTKVILAVRETFKTLREDPEVLSPELAEINKKSFVKSVGFSRSAAAAVYFMLGGVNSKLTPMVSDNPAFQIMKSHYWLWDSKHKILLDPTGDIFTSYWGTQPPYYHSYYGRPDAHRGGSVTFFEKADTATQKIILMATEILEEKGYKPNGSN